MATAGVNLSEYNVKSLPSVKGLRFGIVASEWNAEITDSLLDGSESLLKEVGVPESKIVTIRVPGSFELPIGAKMLIESEEFDAIIAIGSVIQGETRHFEFVCQSVAQGIKDVSLSSGIPVIFCVLTDDTIDQAKARSGGKHGNKGVEAAVAAIKMAAVRRKLIS